MSFCPFNYNLRGLCAAALLLACLSACANPEKSSVLVEKDNGAQFSFPVHTGFEIRLDTSPGTGYGWQLGPYDVSVLEMSKTKLVAKENGKAVGATETQVFVFRTLKQGKTVIVLNYARSWEKDKPPAKTYRVSIDVKNAK